MKEFPVKTDSLREGTINALLFIKKLFHIDASIDRIFFLDAHLTILAFLWPFFYKKRIKRLGVLCLAGPETITHNYFKKAIVSQFLNRSETVLFLRTDELADDWKKAFPKSLIKSLPSLELPTDYIPSISFDNNNNLIKFGIIGQIRIGKSIEWLVPLFQKDPTIGQLTVAGAFANHDQSQALCVLNNFEGFHSKFLTEEELLSTAVKQDYLLMLYDNWDSRMESAVMFIAARVHKPVIVYDKGWLGRMVATYGNGIAVSADQNDFAKFFKSLPKPNSNEYQKLLNGIDKFRDAHSGVKVKNVFLREMFHD